MTKQPESSQMMAGMIKAWNRDSEQPVDRRLSDVWNAAFPFTYNMTVLDLAVQFQTPFLLSALKDLPEYSNHNWSEPKMPRTPTQEDLQILSNTLETVGIGGATPIMLNLILASAVKQGIVKLPED